MNQTDKRPNRRSSPRRPAKRSSRVKCTTGKFGFGPNVAVTLLDMSETGIRLVLNTALATGHEVEISMDSIGGGRQPTRIPGEVIWCVPMADGNHCLGVRFTKALPWAVLLALTNM
jgi:hypothetical protein